MTPTQERPVPASEAAIAARTAPPRPVGPAAPPEAATGPHGDSPRPSGAWVLVTGSRAFKAKVHRDVLDAALTQTWDETRRFGRDRLTILHGAASGADTLAARWTLQHPGVFEIPHPADWTAPCGADCKPGHRKTGRNGEYCPRAGCYRNQVMVNTLLRQTGPRLVIAFFASATEDSAGTADCLRRARLAGLPWRAYDPRGPR